MKWISDYAGFCLLLVLLAFAAGCATGDIENRSERPWNAPTSWEYGLPPEMMQGR
jgi:hypothetical protein